MKRKLLSSLAIIALSLVATTASAYPVTFIFDGSLAAGAVLHVVPGSTSCISNPPIGKAQALKPTELLTYEVDASTGGRCHSNPSYINWVILGLTKQVQSEINCKITDRKAYCTQGATTGDLTAEFKNLTDRTMHIKLTAK